jgi:Ser/Thr protein kinase RdoA (MazF antagonist)
MEQHWERHHSFLRLDREEIERALSGAFGAARVLDSEPLAGGLRNTNYRVRLEGRSAPVVVRLYTADPAACRREVALAARLQGVAPVPSVLHASPESDPPLAVTAWVDGVRFDDLLRAGDAAAVEAAAWSAGATLARIHGVAFPAGGFLGPDLAIRAPLDLSDAGWLGHMEHFLFRGRAGDSLGPDLAARVWRLAAANATRLAPLRGWHALVHADYKPWNLLVRPARAADGAWEVAAVLDWEFAFAGPPLVDLAIFLRHEATLPAGWRAMTKLLDLLNLCSILEQPGGGAARARDIRRLVAATVDGWGAA